MDYILIGAAIVLILIVLFLIFTFQEKKENAKIALINKYGNKIPIDVEVADTSAKRAKGLMFRDSLGANEGMLFVFYSEDYRRFWMMNTTIPLDAIHIAANGTVVEIIQMEPCTSLISCKSYPPSQKAMYVLEVNKGFAEKNGIEAQKSMCTGLEAENLHPVTDNPKLELFQNNSDRRRE